MDTPDILKKILEIKRGEVERLKIEVPVSRLEECIEEQAPPLNFSGALWGDSVRIIAEVKKASPVKGMFKQDLDPVSLAATYVENGAAAISVLTEMDHFHGSIEHMEQVRGVANPHGVPVLRKDFVYDQYQVYESRAHGADAVLLIVAMLTPECLKELLDLSYRFRMQCLVEVHDEPELRIALDAGAEVIGINNRDLRTFQADLAVTEQLAPKVPAGKVIVSESGINGRDQIQRVRRAGAHAALVGESLVTASDVAAKLRELV